MVSLHQAPDGRRALEQLATPDAAAVDIGRSLYDLLGVRAQDASLRSTTYPETVITKTVETVDNDYAAALLFWWPALS